MLSETWMKSTFSGPPQDGGNCVEARRVDGGVEVRDTKDREGGTLAFTGPEWAAFLDGVKGGQFDI